ncbi:MAG: helicase-related protein, partial [Candidatus Bathyarchaeia archaeon]
QVSRKILGSEERNRTIELLAELVSKGVAFHHAGLPADSRKLVEDSFRGRRIKAVTATPTLAAGVNLPARRVVISSYQRYDLNIGRNPISVLEYKQMAGRAGRPKYDDVGEAILIAQTPDEQDYLMQSYVLAKPERIWSKLAAESVLRTHVLATVATGFVKTDLGLNEFFSKTFYAHQFGSEMISALVSKVLKYLYKERMIEYHARILEATKFGRRVSELYIDPVSAVIIRDGLRQADGNVTELGLLHLVCHTPDAPRYYPRSHELEELELYAELHTDEFLVSPPRKEDYVGYQSFLGDVRNVRILEAWINEVSEDGIIEKFRFEPGDLFRLNETVDWLLYATYELAQLEGRTELLPLVQELRERVQKGVKSELLPIARLRGIGRVRSRMLYNAGYSSLEALRNASIEQLLSVPTLGPSLVKSIKEQVGATLSREELYSLKRSEFMQKSISEY